MCGFILVTADRNGAIIIIPPNVPSRILDFDWRSGRDKAWDEFVIQAGGREAIEKRLANVGAILPRWKSMLSETVLQIDRVFKEHLTKIYGPDKGIECFRSTKFAVHPDFQGHGIGRAIHEKMCSIVGWLMAGPSGMRELRPSDALCRLRRRRHPTSSLLLEIRSV